MSHAPGRLPERTQAELERVEDDIERLIVESTKRDVTTDELATLFEDYADDLDELTHLSANTLQQ